MVDFLPLSTDAVSPFSTPSSKQAMVSALLLFYLVARVARPNPFLHRIFPTALLISGMTTSSDLGQR